MKRSFLKIAILISSFIFTGCYSDESNKNSTNENKVKNENSSESLAAEQKEPIKEVKRIYFRPKERERIKEQIQVEAETIFKNRNDEFFEFQNYPLVDIKEIVKDFIENKVNAEIKYDKKLSIKGNIKDFHSGPFSSTFIKLNTPSSIYGFDLQFWPDQKQFVAKLKKNTNNTFFCDRVELIFNSLSAVGCQTPESIINKIKSKIELEIDAFEKGELYKPYLAQHIFFGSFMREEYNLKGCKTQKCSIDSLINSWESNKDKKGTKKDEKGTEELIYYTSFRLYEFAKIILDVYPESKLVTEEQLADLKKSFMESKEYLIQNGIGVVNIKRE